MATRKKSKGAAGKVKSKARKGKSPAARRKAAPVRKKKSAPSKIARKPVRPKVKIAAGKVEARHDVPRPGEVKVGTVEHYYTHIGVIGMTLTGTLKVGEAIRIAGHTSDFTEEVKSMQINHADVTEAKAGDSIGLKVVERAREGDTVFRVGS